MKMILFQLLVDVFMKDLRQLYEFVLNAFSHSPNIWVGSEEGGLFLALVEDEMPNLSLSTWIAIRLWAGKHI
jgi:hypothetical protein